ncbi:MAG: N-acetylmuramoyl-L-alanine amidase family protein [Christensenellales bacterium]
MKAGKKYSVSHMAALVLLALAVVFIYGNSRSRESSGAPEAEPLQGKCIVLDPGHGGYDGGAEGIDGVKEAGLNLQICLYLERELIDMGAKVVLTRYEDIALASRKRPDMEKRNQIVLDSRADIALSIHLNAHPDRSISGPMVYYTLGDLKSMALCQAVQDALNQELGREKIIHAGDYYFLENGIQPRIIVECGFISNPAEEAQLIRQEYQQRLARVIAQGILKYFSDTPFI